MNTYNFLFLISLLIACSYTLRTSKTNAKAEEHLSAEIEEQTEAQTEEHLSAEIEEQMEAQTETATKTQAQSLCKNWMPPMNKKKTSQKSSKSNNGAAVAILNSENGKSEYFGYRKFTHTNKSTNNWWKTYLDEPMDIKKIEIKNRVDCCGERLAGVKVYVDDKLCGTLPNNTPKNTWFTVTCNNLKGQRIKLVKPDNGYLAFSGILVTSPPRKKCTKAERQAEYSSRLYGGYDF